MEEAKCNLAHTAPMEKTHYTSKDIVNSLGFKAKQEKVFLLFTWGIHRSNYDNLRAAIIATEAKRFSQEEEAKMFGKDAFDVVGRFPALFELMSPTVTGLNNFLSTCYAMRDTLYGVDSFIVETLGRSEIRQKMTDTFSDAPEAAFLQNLRNNYLHGSGVFPTLMRQHIRGEDDKLHYFQYFCFDKDSILTKGEWNEKSKAYVKSWENKNKKLLDIVDTYFVKIRSFQEWAVEYFNNLFAEEYLRTDEMVEAFLAPIRKGKPTT